MHTECPQNADECRWMQMNADECRWMQMNADECRWMQMNAADECSRWMQQMNADECSRWMQQMNADACPTHKIKIIKLENFINMLFFEIIERIEVDLKNNLLDKYDIKEIECIVCNEKSIGEYIGDNSYIDSYILDIIIDEIEKD